MPTFRLTLEYEGTRYRGWQEQKNARTVAGELRRALEEVAGAPIELGGAGRTDAGVHAVAQVAHLRSARRLARPFPAAVNEALPADIHLLSIAPADDRFHARHPAVARAYLYQIARRRTAFGKRFVWWIERPLDLDAMASAAARVVGRHDFARVATSAAKGSTLVVVESAEIVAPTTSSCSASWRRIFSGRWCVDWSARWSRSAPARSSSRRSPRSSIDPTPRTASSRRA